MALTFNKLTKLIHFFSYLTNGCLNQSTDPQSFNYRKLKNLTFLSTNLYIMWLFIQLIMLLLVISTNQTS